MRLLWIRRIVVILMLMILLMGVFWIVFGISLIKDDQMQGSMDEEQSVEAAVEMLLGFGCFLVGWSLLGFLAVVKRHTCLLGLYNSGIFALLFVTGVCLYISILVVVVLPDYMNDTKCTTEPLLVSLRELNERSVEVFCQPECQCSYEGSLTDQLALGMSNVDADKGVDSVQHCSIYSSDEFKNYTRYGDGLNEIEVLFACSGVCSVNRFHVFSDVNQKPPNRDCKVEVIDYLNTHSEDFLRASIVLSALFLVSFIFSCMLCFKKPKGASYFEEDGVGYFQKEQS